MVPRASQPVLGFELEAATGTETAATIQGRLSIGITTRPINANARIDHLGGVVAVSGAGGTSPHGRQLR